MERGLPVFLLFVAAALPAVLSMECTFTETNAFEKVVSTCPRPIIDSPDKKYCCFKSDGEFYCCEGGTFAIYVVVGLIIILIPISILCCLICCIWRCIRSRF